MPGILARIALAAVLAAALLVPIANGARAAENAAGVEKSDGLLLVLAQAGGTYDSENYYAPRARTDEYRTVWLTADGYAVDCAAKKGIAVAAAPDGFYMLEQIRGKRQNEKPYQLIEINKTVSYKIGQEHQTEVPVRDYERPFYSSEGFHLDFVGGNYMAVMKIWVYTTGAGGYQYHPSITFCELGSSVPAALEKDADKGGLIAFKDLVAPEAAAAIDDQTQAYKYEFDKTVKVESAGDKQYIAAADLTLRRRDGRWQLMVPLQFSNWKYSHNYFVSFHPIDIPLPPALVGHNELCLPFAAIKRLIPEAVDAVSSPDNWLLVVQTAASLQVFVDPLNGLDKPVFVFPIGDGEKIVHNRWAPQQALPAWNEQLSRLLAE